MRRLATGASTCVFSCLFASSLLLTYTLMQFRFCHDFLLELHESQTY